MRKESVDFLSSLIETPSPSGFEQGVQALMRDYMAPVCDDVQTDVSGNVMGVMNPGADMRIMLAGHIDEIGFMVMHIDGSGFIGFSAVGGVDASIVSGRRVNIHNSKGKDILGVIGRVPIHMSDGDQKGAPKFHSLCIDIGARTKAEAEKLVSIGDYITFVEGFSVLRRDLVIGRGFDDRAGAFVVAETMRKLKGKKLNVAVHGVATVQEEIGLRGAKTSAFNIEPHVGIAIDVGFATDFPGMDAKRVGECKVGKGPLLHRGPNMNPKVQKILESTATKKKIPFQVTAISRSTPTDANAIQTSRGGVATSLLSVPNRYMHTPVELLSLKDLDNASKLLAEFVLALKGNESFIPGI